jgi:hypothetical protein
MKVLLDKEMGYANSDDLTEIELMHLFEKLDNEERYFDMLKIMLWYKRTILTHYQLTHTVFRYNISTADLSAVKIDDVYLLDIITIVKGIPVGSYELLDLLRVTLFKNKNLEKEERRLMKRVYQNDFTI